MNKNVFALIVVALFVISLTVVEGKHDDWQNTEARHVNPDVVQQARQKFDQAQQRFLTAKANSGNALASYRAVRDRFLACKDVDENDSECKNITASALEHLKSVVMYNADLFIRHLEKINEKIAESDNINDTDATLMSEVVDNTISKLEAAKFKVANATTRKEVHNISVEIKYVWSSFVSKSKVYSFITMYGKIARMVGRAAKLEDRFDRMLENLTASGYNTTNLAANITAFDDAVEAAITHINISKAKLAEARALLVDNTTDENKTMVVTLLQDARKSLVDAQFELMDAAHALRGILHEYSILVHTDAERTAEDELSDADRQTQYDVEA